jgi:hypothetical protein
MKTFIVTYVPHGREDKEWIAVEAVSKEKAVKDFIAGTLIDIREEE